jgi:integrase
VLRPKSRDWVQRSAKVIWELTRGEISFASIAALKTYALNKYPSVDSRSKILSNSKAFLVFLSRTKIDQRYQSFSIYLDMPRAVKEQRSLTEKIVTIEDVRNVLAHIKRAEQTCKISKQRAAQYTAYVIFASFSGQRSESTIAKLTCFQFREALKMEKPVLHVESSQDKLNTAHWVPLHPQVVEAVKPLLEGTDDDEPTFKHESFKMWVKREKIPLSRFDKNFFIGALRKWAEQHGDIIQWNETNRAHILTHGIGSTAFKHYKGFQKDSVYDIYMEAWREVDLTG